MAIERYYKLNPVDGNGVPFKGYRQRIYREWFEQGPFGDATEKRICDKARAIRKNGWLKEAELEMMERRINTTGPQETDQEENQGVEDIFPDSDGLVARAKLSISINEASEEERIVVNELKKIYDLGENSEAIIFKKVDFTRVNAAVRRVNI